MRETNITRRRVMQGVGAVGVATVGGSAVISAQEDGNGDGDGNGGDDTAAFRVAHASPDAPEVNVRLYQTADGNGGGGDEGGDENGDGQNGGGGDQDGGQNGDGGDQDADVQIEGLGFSEVTEYNEVEPDTYHAQLVVTDEGFLDGVLSDLFGDEGDDDETLIFDDQVDFEAGTTYTLVAFGEVARGPVPAEDAEEEAANETNGMDGNESDGMEQNASDGAEQNESDGMEGDGNDGGGQADGAGEDGQLIEQLAFGEHETVELDAGNYSLEVQRAGAGGTDGGAEDGEMEDDADGNETGNETGGNETNGEDAGDDGGEETPADEGDSALGFQVAVLEDDITGPGEDQSRVRVFHAVPDVDAVSITASTGEEGVPDDGAGDEPAGDDQPAGDEPGDEAGDGMDGEQNGDGGGNDTDGMGGDEPPAQQEEGVRRASISTEGGGVYSGFAVGYFDPQAAATVDEDGQEDGGMNGQDEGDGENGTDRQNETNGQDEGDDGQAEDGDEGEEVAEDGGGQEFQFVTVEDAQGGERSDGGTGGLLSVAPPASR